MKMSSIAENVKSIKQRVAEADAALTRIENAVKALDWLLETGTPRGEAALEPETPEAALVATLDAAALTDRVAVLRAGFTEAMDDDLNSPMVISALFDWVRIINQIAEGRQRITAADLAALTATVKRYVFDILGLRDEKAASAGGGRDRVTPLVEMLLRMRMEAKAAKDWATSDRIRDELTAIGIRVKDRKDGFDWEIE